MAAPVIIVMGPQGSGKGTQCQLLSQKLQCVTLSSGALLRASKDPEIRGRIDRGILARSQDVNQVMKSAMEAVRPPKDIIIDGYPRMVNEAEWLINTLDELDRQIQAVILLLIPRDESVKRLMERAAAQARDDDTLDRINRRLDQYEAETHAVLDMWRSKQLLREVDGMGTVEEVAARIDQALV